LIFADPTTGAQNDIDRATTIARQMVTEFGMSDSLGPMRFGHPQGEVFLGRDFTSTPDYSDEVAASIDGEVRRLIESAHDVAAGVLHQNREILDRLASARDARDRARAGDLRRRADVGFAHVGRGIPLAPAPRRVATGARAHECRGRQQQ